MKQTLHAFVTMPGLSDEGPMVFDLGDEAQRRYLMEEIMSHETDAIAAYDPNLTLTYDDPWLRIDIVPMPVGYAETLPEHGGW